MRDIAKRERPEAIIQRAFQSYLILKGWHVKSTHGNAYQSGFPDDRASHSVYGGRWIEYKLPGMRGSRFTHEQLQNFPKMMANGDPIWIISAANDAEYAKLFKPSNFWLAMEGIL